MYNLHLTLEEVLERNPLIVSSAESRYPHLYVGRRKIRHWCFEADVKPDSFIASSVADRISK